MSDRLDELQRQRALAQEQVAWFDREIARLKGETPTTATPAAPVTPAPVAAAPVSPDQTEQAAADILARYNQENKPGSMAKDAKRGCVIYFVFLMLALGMCAVFLYVLYTHSQ